MGGMVGEIVEGRRGAEGVRKGCGTSAWTGLGWLVEMAWCGTSEREGVAGAGMSTRAGWGRFGPKCRIGWGGQERSGVSVRGLTLAHS